MNSQPDNDARPAALVSACLLGRACRYDGRDNHDSLLEQELARRGLRAVPFCPEEHGGLDTPRPPAWLTGGGAHEVLDGAARLVTNEGRDVTAQFRAGAEGALEACRSEDIKDAFLKERSPSCGVCQTHVDDELVDGPGVTTALLEQNGVRVHGVEGRRQPPAD